MAKFVYNPYPSTRDRNIFSGMSIKQDGGWVKLNTLIFTLKPRLQKSFDLASDEIARKYRNNIRSIIRSQGKAYGWQPLKPKYQAKKLKQSSKGMYRYYDVLYNGFVITKTKTGIQVGIPKSLRGDISLKRGNADMTVSQYLYVLEHGSFWHDIKPRPLLGPAWKMLGGKVGVATTLSKHLKRQIQVI